MGTGPNNDDPRTAPPTGATEGGSLPAKAAVAFYRFWHGRIHWKGAGLLLTFLAPRLRGLRRYSLTLPEGHSVHVDFTDASAWYWLNHLAGDRLEEAGLIEAIAAVAQPGDTVWDVGANGGIFSYLLAKRLPACPIVFFEPNPAAHSLAAEALAPFGRIRGLRAGLSSGAWGDAEMFVPEGASTTGSVGASPRGRGKRVAIVLERGDALVASGEVPAPALIKIDTEGHEAEVLLGLRETIARLKPKIFFEHIGLSDEQVASLVPAGYDIFSVSDKDGETRRGFDRSCGHNSALFPLEPRGPDEA